MYCAGHMSLRLGLLSLAGLGLCAAPLSAHAAPPAKAAAPKAAKPAGAAAKPAKDPDDDLDAPAADAKPAAGKPSAKAKPGAKVAKDAAPVAEEALPPAEPPPPPPPEELPPSDMEGTSENPSAPVDYDAPRPDLVPVAPPRPAGYPVEEVLRPLTLPRFMTEVALDARFNISPFINGQTLRARFGVTSQVQVGLLYNIGGIYDDGPRDTAFNTGKAVAIAGTYKIREWVAAQLVVPMYLEPFAASFTLGAPMKFVFADKFALVLAEDVLEVRVTEFVPSLTSELENEVNVTNVETNTQTSRGTFRFSGAGFYQHKPDLAFTARLAVSILDFDSQSLGYLLKVGVQKTVIKNLDLTALMGFDDLGDADNTFGLQLGAAFRI